MSGDPRFTRWCLPIAMLVGVALLYLPRQALRGDLEFLGLDFLMLHQHRIDFVQTALKEGSLPAWYPREFCGSPFWANAQNFPFIPTRLALLWLPPAKLFAASVIVSAMLAALFTYLFARRLSFHPAGAAVAGWTFAASGFFASRIATGHLPLLEAYPALPLLLWLIERLTPSPSTLGEGRGRGRTVERHRALSVLALGIAAMCISLAGHPQLPIYALAAAAVYALIRLSSRMRWLSVAAMAAGVGCASFVLVPMSILVARSTRIMNLDRAPNDIPMPYERLPAALLPWRDYVPNFDPANHFGEFTSSPWFSYFWDTVWYVGLWPWAAVGGLLVLWIRGGARIDRRIAAVAIVAIGALLLALPWARELTASTGSTILRSPARLVYLTIFGLSLAGGGAISAMWRYASAVGRRAWPLVVMLIVALHAIDLGLHDRRFIQANRPPLVLPAAIESDLIRQIGDGRAGIDLIPLVSLNRRVDDVSLFDSIILLRSYRAIAAMKNAPAGYNNQWLSVNIMDSRILRMCGVRAIITLAERPWMPLWHRAGDVNIYKLHGAADRAAFVPMARVFRGSDVDAERLLRDQAFDPVNWMIVEDTAAPASTQPTGERIARAQYSRPSSDKIVVSIEAPAGGYVRIIEAFDRGWHATVDGRRAEIVPANLMFMAVRVEPGSHTIELEYRTPGATFGAIGSSISFIALIAIGWISPRLCPLSAVGEELQRQRLDPPTQ